MDDFKDFTKRAREALACARAKAAELNHDYVGAEHLLYGIAMLPESVAMAALEALYVNSKQIVEAFGKRAKPASDVVTMGQLPFTPRAKKIFQNAREEAKCLGDKFVGTEHLLLALIREDEGVAAEILFKDLGLKPLEIKEEIHDLLGEKAGDPPPVEIDVGKKGGKWPSSRRTDEAPTLRDWLAAHERTDYPISWAEKNGFASLPVAELRARWRYHMADEMLKARALRDPEKK